jgi:large subunit ribosomal protein L6
LQLGYSHDVNIAGPDDLTVATRTRTTVVSSGTTGSASGQLAAEIRQCASRALQGQGHQYRGEFIFRKEGKKK